MPWSQTNVTKERVKFVLEWERRWQATHGGRVDGTEVVLPSWTALATEYPLHERALRQMLVGTATVASLTLRATTRRACRRTR
jgi:hypothetical protein